MFVNASPENVSYSFYLYYVDKVDIVNNSFFVNETGNYSLRAIFNNSGEIELRTTTFQVVTELDNNETEENNNTIQLFDYCEETCQIIPPLKDPTKLRINIENSEIMLNRIDYKSKNNNMPVQIKNIPTISFINNTEINLSEYFEDPDGDRLYYDITNIIGIDEMIS